MTVLVADLRAALALLTRLPVGAVVDGRAGAALFPVVGLGIGLVAAIPVALAGAAQPTLAAIAAVALVAIMSGGLHLDALADTADALMAPDPVRAEAARRDPRIGSGGVIALVLVLGAEVAAIAGLAGAAGSMVAAGAVVVAASAARAVPVVLVAPWAGHGPNAGAGGVGDWFRAQVRRRDAVVAVALVVATVAVATSILAAPSLAVGAMLGTGLGVATALAIRALRGRWDGDALGASLELTVLAVLVSTALVHG